jgi:hypothetical protein
MANRPDVIIRNRKQKAYILIDVAIPADRNAAQKESRKCSEKQKSHTKK